MVKHWKKLWWLIRQFSLGLYIFSRNLWNLPSDIWAQPSEMSVVQCVWRYSSTLIWHQSPGHNELKDISILPHSCSTSHIMVLWPNTRCDKGGWQKTPHSMSLGMPMDRTHCMHGHRRNLGAGTIWDIWIQKHKSCKIWFGLHFFLRCPMILKFCTELGSITAELLAKFQNHDKMATILQGLFQMPSVGENFFILVKYSLNCVPNNPIDKSALVFKWWF